MCGSLIDRLSLVQNSRDGSPAIDARLLSHFISSTNEILIPDD